VIKYALARRIETRSLLFLIYPRGAVVESSTGLANAPVAKTSQGPIPPSFWISWAKVRANPINPKMTSKESSRKQNFPIETSFEFSIIRVWVVFF